MWDKSWTEGKYDQSDINRISNTIKKLIELNDGEYTGKIGEIANAAGYSEKEYGIVFNAMQEVKRLNGISSVSRGRNGNTYTFDIKSVNNIEDKVKNIDNMSDRELAIKSILNVINVDNVTLEEAKMILKSVATILK